MNFRPVRLVLVGILAWLTVAALDVSTASTHAANRGDDKRRADDRQWRLTKVDVDSNFDGRPDIQEYYARGVLVRRESDRNFDGRADLIEEFDADTRGRTRSVIDVDFDGTADLLVLFRDDEPVFSEQNHSAKHGAPPKPIQFVQAVDDNSLIRLVDPFRSESAIRTVRVESSDLEYAGVSTAGGLPSTRVGLARQVVASPPLIPSNERFPRLNTPLQRSPRAPPVS
jgi:hypothetical protein